MRTVAVLLDGGHLRTYARKAGKAYDPPFIERFGRACVKGDQTLQRILYYDCAPYTGVPAMKYARRAGLQITLVRLTNCRPAPELCAHSDSLLSVQFP